MKKNKKSANLRMDYNSRWSHYELKSNGKQKSMKRKHKNY